MASPEKETSSRGDHPVPLLLLPGLDGTGCLFRPLLAHLPPSIAPVTVQYPADRRAAIDELAGIVLEVASGHNSPVALAESFSGPILLQALALEPGRFRAAIFVNSFSSCPRPLLLMLASTLPLRLLFSCRIPGILIRALCLGPTASPRLIDEVRDVLTRVRPVVLADRIRILAALHPPPDQQIHIPCLYLQGARDRLVPAACAAWFQEGFADAQLVKIDGPHFLLQARPEAAASVIEEFCRDGFQR